MRILYGVVGEGMGHAIRSRVIMNHLIYEKGHEIEVVVSGRAHKVLQSYFPEVHKIWGLNMTYRNNEFRIIRSVVENIKQALQGIPENVLHYFDITRDFKPEVVISDFESWSYLYGIRHNLPIISVDNIQMTARCRHPREFLQRYQQIYQVTKGFIRAKIHGCEHYYITSFFYPKVRKPRTTLVPSVLRQEILNQKPTAGDHILVYLTSESARQFPDIMKQVDFPFRVYGLKRDIIADQTEGNITFRPFNETTFIEDLASAKAVIANGGFTLMGEAVYLHKPVFCIPLKSQFEQVLNAFYLNHLQFGYSANTFTLNHLKHFLKALPLYQEKVATYEQKEGNGKLFRLLDDHLEQIAQRG